jgi:CheY-like chemotaxis protein/HPt (histidine-containing phosphotransfer) domain-containing protein
LDLEALNFDLRSTLEQAGSILGIRAHDKNLEYVCLIEPEVPSLIQGDPGRLSQILNNLIGNAIKFTHEGEVRLQVSVDGEDEDEVTLRFEVTDTGIGIPREKISSLFSAFTQVDASTTRMYGGTGLGLSISKQLSELMGGQIGIESEEGKGSTFWFTAVFKKQPEVISIPMEPQDDLPDTNILVVDDNAIARRVLVTLLRTWQCRYEEAPDGESALEKLRAAATRGNPFRIAILDMQMPEMNGETLGKIIKEDPILRETSLVMLTSMARRGDASRFETAGFSAYLTKPVRQSQLYECLRIALGRAASEGRTARESIITRHTVAEAGRRKIRILLAEDNIVNQKVALKMIEKLGYRADPVSNGLEAVNALRTVPYDLVLMDIQMPEMDGIEATRVIRKDRSTQVLNRNIPIIAMTAHTMKGDREKCIEEGMNDYLSKPIQAKELAAALDRWIAEGGQSQRPQRPSEAKQTGSIFDMDDLLRRVDGDKEFLAEIVSLFLQDMPKQMNILAQALTDNDASLCYRQAHTIKGASANLGAKAMQIVASEIETAGRNGDMEGAAAAFEKLKDQFAVTEVALADLNTAHNIGQEI